MSEGPNISERIAAVMAEVGRVERDARNAHANYDYASADAVYDAVRPLLAKHGLVVRQQCAPLLDGTVDGVVHLCLRVSTYFDGEECPPPVPVPLPIKRFTPQAVQAALTYAQKYFLRGALCLATGEPDADADVPPEPQPAPAKPNLPTPGLGANGEFVLAESGEDAVAWAVRGDKPERAVLYRAIIAAVGARTEGWDQIVTWYGNELKRLSRAAGVR